MTFNDEAIDLRSEPEVDDAPYAPASVTRLQLALAAQGICDDAVTLVAVEDQEITDVPEALSLVRVADHTHRQTTRAKAAAIFHAATVGANWEQIAETLGQKRQAVYRAYNPELIAWRAEATDAHGLPRLPAIEDDTVALLDHWLALYAGPDHAHAENRGVSSALRRMTSEEELDVLLAHAREPLPLDELAAVRERQTVLYERLADAEPDAEIADGYRRYATRTRGQAAELRELLAARAAAAGDEDRDSVPAIRICGEPSPGNPDRPCTLPPRHAHHVHQTATGAQWPVAPSAAEGEG
ncbi:hypothetical protein OG948_59240 (plasmid) [Embleya sp. NBC_00888]|uniref:hypothetical protein n=1 Tax=Embleya sp. NBC_00888 TaxID=2975960 RepID=UPI002F907D5F|nr:hypothetical protein OG948_59240 [Embleya sp. NBC_00888]